ncbi:hypothetical protein RB195_017230 [Necator americanus]|uniref:Uncharacterized protein n=1 Tax=Necator americanus TaxID=51031 RepID=A0ABR1C5A4_NECAM
MLLLLLVGLRTATACIASVDPEDVTTPPPPCLTCPLPVYRNNCNGVSGRSPCPNSAQANVQARNSGTDCILVFRCPAGTRAFVWPTGRNTPIPYSGTDLICDGPGGNQWRTDMGLNVESLSCMGPVPVVDCTLCPSVPRTYVDCTIYGRMNCYPNPAMISADIQKTGQQCRLIVLCGPGTTFHYIGPSGPVDTGSTIGIPICTMTGLTWVFMGTTITGVTCMSAT